MPVLEGAGACQELFYELLAYLLFHGSLENESICSHSPFHHTIPWHHVPGEGSTSIQD